MDLGLKGKTILVTGGGSGIGRETAQLLAGEGAKIALFDLNQKGLAETKSLLEGAKAACATYEVNITDHGAVEKAIGKAVSDLGPLYGVCNVAGVLVGKPFEESTPADWQAELEVCLKGTMIVSHAAIAELRKIEYGKIVNVASDAGRIGEKTMVAYSAAKGGVIAFTKALAKQLGRYRTNVNAVAPGTTKTPMTSFLTPEMEEKWSKLYPLRRLGTPQDIARCIAFFCSNMSDWITGQVISVNGGFSMNG